MSKFARLVFLVAALVLTLALVHVAAYASDGRTSQDETVPGSVAEVVVFVPGYGDVTMELYDYGGIRSLVLPEWHPYVEGLDQAIDAFHGVNRPAESDNLTPNNENTIMTDYFRSGSNAKWLNDARSRTYLQGTYRVGFWSVEWRNVSGNSDGTWARSGTTAQHIILISHLCFNGVSVTVTWPPSFTGSSNCSRYESLPFPNRNFAQQFHSGAYASSRIRLNSVVQSDSAVVRFGGVDYRPASSVSLPSLSP